MLTYFLWVRAHPLASAMVQFAVLGPLGEFLAAWMGSRKNGFPFTFFEFLLKLPAWALLGLVIKYGFTGMKGFTHGLLDAHFLPSGLASGLGWAFTLSVLTNLMFGPLMIAIHRLEDNLILHQSGFAGIQRAWWTLLYFWVPAHTITFCLPAEYQIGLAALWGMVLGLILGLAKRGRTTQVAHA